jgi:phosphatidylserine decarboxylase
MKQTIVAIRSTRANARTRWQRAFCTLYYKISLVPNALCENNTYLPQRYRLGCLILGEFLDHLQRLLRVLGLAPWGADELVIAVISCCFAAYSLSIWVHPWAALLALVPLAIVVWFFRDPPRSPDHAPWPHQNVCCSPADGTVSDIEELDEPLFIQGRALRIGIFLSPFNVHVNRMPCSGLVRLVKFAAGEFLPAYNKEAPTRNESVTVGLLTLDGLPIVVKQITGVLARRIICDATVGDTLLAGQRYGMIKFGSRTELYVPVNAHPECLVKIGDRVVGGETQICKIPERINPMSSETAMTAEPQSTPAEIARPLGAS